MMDIDKIRRKALLQGFTLVPVSEVLRSTLRDIKGGCDRASVLALKQGITSTAASNRFRSLERFGLLSRSKAKESREVTFSVSKLGQSVRWS